MSEPRITLRLLGGVELLGRDGQPARALLAQPRRLALFLYLAVAIPRGFRRKDTVRALFWPEADTERARQSLNRAIYVLRQVLDPAVLLTRGDDEIAVAPERLRCDVVAFEAALDGGELEPALELYRGDLAPGFLVSDLPDFEQWLESERTRLRERAVDAAMKLADNEEAAGRLELAERWAQRAETLAPYAERAAARRISLLDRMGDRASAVRVYQTLRDRLREHFDVTPSPETEALIGAVRARRSPARPVERPPLVAPAPPLAAGREPPTGEAAERAGAAPSAPAAPIARAGRRRLTGAMVLALVATVSALLARPRTFTLTTAHALPITSEPGIEFQPALSPDGNRVAFVAVEGRRRLVAVRDAREQGAAETRLAPGEAEDDELPAWSADGNLVRFASMPNPGTLPESFVRSANTYPMVWKEADGRGGPSRPVEPLERTRWAAWSRDEARVAWAARDSIFVAERATGRVRLLAVDSGAGPHSLAFSPDGRWIAYVSGNWFWPTGWNTSPSTIRLVATDDGRRVDVTDSVHLNMSPVWLDARHLLFVSDRDGQREVYATEIAASGARGPTVKVPGGTDAHSISVSADGSRLAVAKFVIRQNVRSFPLSERRPLLGHEGRPVTSGSQVVETHDVSPDGKWLAYDSNLRGDADIYVMRLDSGAPLPLVTTPGMTFSPRWSPDGRELAFYGGPGAGDIWTVPAVGGAPTRVTDAPGLEELPIWSPDGLHIAYRSFQSGRQEAWVVSRERIDAPWSVARQLTDFGCAYQTWAADGLLCGSPNRNALTLVSLSGAVRWRRDFSNTGLRRMGPPELSPDGTMLYVGASLGGQAGIWAVPLGGGAPRLVVSFADPSLVVQSYPGTINVTRDRLYVTVAEFESDIWVMELVRR